MISRRLWLAAFGALSDMDVPSARADDPARWFPARPLRLVVTYPPGGVNDIVGRIVADPLGSELGQPVVVENRAGAGGSIGTAAAAQAEPDGLTLLFGATAMFGVNPILYPNTGVDVLRDFTCLGTLGEVANVLSVVPSRVQARTVAELAAEGKRRPLTYGSVGNGTSSHLSAVVFLKNTGIEAVHVPYRGSSPLVAAMLAGDVDFGFDTTATSTERIRTGAFRPLAVTTVRRASALPEVPTMQEAGLTNYDLGIWFALFTNRRVPNVVVQRLRQAVAKSLTERTISNFRRAYVDPLMISEPELQDYILKTSKRWESIAREAHITAD